MFSFSVPSLPWLLDHLKANKDDLSFISTAVAEDLLEKNMLSQTQHEKLIKNPGKIYSSGRLLTWSRPPGWFEKIFTTKKIRGSTGLTRSAYVADLIVKSIATKKQLKEYERYLPIRQGHRPNRNIQKIELPSVHPPKTVLVLWLDLSTVP